MCCALQGGKTPWRDKSAGLGKLLGAISMLSVACGPDKVLHSVPLLGFHPLALSVPRRLSVMHVHPVGQASCAVRKMGPLRPVPPHSPEAHGCQVSPWF